MNNKIIHNNYNLNFGETLIPQDSKREYLLKLYKCKINVYRVFEIIITTPMCEQGFLFSVREELTRSKTPESTSVYALGEKKYF